MKLALRLISIAWQLFVATITLSCAFLSGKWYYNDTASLDKMNVDFEYEGELTADIALNTNLREMYPFNRLTGPANVLVMPGLHSAHISSKMLQELGDGTMVGPILIGLEKPAQIVQMSANVNQIVNMAAIAAIDAIESKASQKQ